MRRSWWTSERGATAYAMPCLATGCLGSVEALVLLRLASKTQNPYDQHTAQLRALRAMRCLGDDRCRPGVRDGKLVAFSVT